VEKPGGAEKVGLQDYLAGLVLVDRQDLVGLLEILELLENMDILERLVGVELLVQLVYLD
jgi:hypothetical protein